MQEWNKCLLRQNAGLDIFLQVLQQMIIFFPNLEIINVERVLYENHLN